MNGENERPSSIHIATGVDEKICKCALNAFHENKDELYEQEDVRDVSDEEGKSTDS